jgi:hypothetical protein
LAKAPDFAAYQQAMARHGEHPVRVEMTVLHLTLRHPAFPASIRTYVESWVAEAITSLGCTGPVLEQVLAAGNDPTQDVRP